jgi:hypothetical protein
MDWNRIEGNWKQTAGSRPDEFARPYDQIKRPRAALDNNRTPFLSRLRLKQPSLVGVSSRRCDGRKSERVNLNESYKIVDTSPLWSAR